MLKRWILPAATFLLLLITHIPQTHATIKYWNGTGTGAFNVGRNWSLYPAGSGSTTTAPTMGDVAIFDGSSNNVASITQTMTGSSIEIRPSYTGTITLSGSVTLTLNALTIGSSSATLRMGSNSKLVLLGNGTPFTGSGTLDTTTNTPNLVEYRGPAITNIAAGSTKTYNSLLLDPPGFSRNASIPLATGESLPSQVVDTGSGYIYAATSTNPIKIIKIRLSDYSRVATLTLNTGETSARGIVLDKVNGFLYVTATTNPGTIIKIRLSDFTRVGSLTLNSGEAFPRKMVIDTANGFLYTYLDPSGSCGPTRVVIVVKVRLSDFTEVSALTLIAGESCGNAIAFDEANGMLYIATGNTLTNTGAIVRVRLSDLTEIDAIKTTAVEGGIASAVLDTTTGYLYVGTSVSGVPGNIVKIRTSDFTRVGTLVLNSGEVSAGAIALDTGTGYGYVAVNTTPGRIIQFRLSDLTRVISIDLKTGENGYSFGDSTIDTANGFLYGSTLTNPGILYRVSLGYTPTLRLGTAASQTLTVNGTLTLGDGTNAAPVSAATYNPILDLNGSLILNPSSSLTAPPSALFTLSGDLTNKGTFTGNGGTLILDGSAQTLSGSITFYKLSKTTGSSLAIAYGSTITTQESLTLLGTESTLLNIHSTSTTHPWYINSSHNRSIQYLALSDSTNTNVPITCLDCSNDGNNTGWLFGTSPTSNSNSSSGNTGGGGGGGGGGTRSTNTTTSTSSSSKGTTTQPSSSPSNTTSPSSYFTDLSPTAWFFPYVTELTDLHIVDGYKDAQGNPLRLFGPSDNVTYAQLAKLALGTAGESVTEQPGIHWATPYLDRVHALRYSVYTSTLNENLPATRGAVIQTLLEALRIPLDQPSNSYSDVPSTHPFAKAIATATKLGLIQGDSNADGSPKGTFRPNSQVNRAELSKILILARQLPKQPLSALTSPESTPPPSEAVIPSAQTVTTKFAVNVRSEPAMSSPILLQLPPNTTVDRLSSIGEWIQVRLPDGRTGYLVGSYLR